MCKKGDKRGSEIGTIGFADDLVIISGIIEEAQENLEALNQKVQTAGMEISLSKTEMIVVNGEGSNHIYLIGKKQRN